MIYRRYNNEQKEGICGDNVPGNKCYVQRNIFCDDYIVSQYYNHLNEKQSWNERGDRLVTEGICKICYTFDNVMSKDIVKQSRDIGGKKPLLVCISFFNSSIKIHIRRFK